MSTPDLSAFNFSFDPTLDTWAVSDEPAELDSSEIFLPNVEGRTEFLPPDPDRVPVIENSVRTDDPAYAARPADERTHELLSQMRRLRGADGNQRHEGSRRAHQRPEVLRVHAF